MGNTTRADKNHAIRGVIRRDVVDQILSRDGFDVLFGSQDGASQRLVHIRGGVEVVENHFFQLLVNLLLLPKDHIPFTFNGRGLELGTLEDIGENVDGLGDVGVEGFGVVDGVFALRDMLEGD